MSADVIFKRVPDGMNAYAISKKAKAFLAGKYSQDSEGSFPFGRVTDRIRLELEENGLSVEVEP